MNNQQHTPWHHTRHWPQWTWQVSDSLRQWVTDTLREAHDTKHSCERGGNTEGAQNCAIRIRICEQIRIELRQRDAAAHDQHAREHREWEARERYTSKRNSLWAQVLWWARSGELPPGWRDHLPGYCARIAAIVGEELRDDIDGLILHEFATLPPQPWEPGGDWRTALDAWYRDMLTVHNRRRQQDQEMHASKPQPFQLPSRPITNEKENDPWLEFQLKRALHLADIDAIQAINHERRRDQIEAWYRAGLSAGGDDEDWESWYRDRINNTWQRRHDTIYGRGLITADRELAYLGQLVGEAAAGGRRLVLMHTLPDYWRTTSPPTP
jgi:hypothetical protein